MSQAKQHQRVTGTCPACHDRLMVFEPIDDEQGECGGCGSVVKLVEVEVEGDGVVCSGHYFPDEQ